MTTRVLIAYADTGGGHRAAAEALDDALRHASPSTHVVLADPSIVGRKGRWTLFSRSYPMLLRFAPWLWRAGFALTNSPRAARLLARCCRIGRRIHGDPAHAIEQPDVVVSTHPLLTAALRARFPDTPLVVVVTDLRTGHASWYEPTADRIVVPTAHAYARALACGVPAHRLELVGVPIRRECAARPGERDAMRAHLGWPATRATVLLAGGGDGVGAIETLAAAIDGAELPCDLVVIAGRNVALAARLRRRQWRGAVRIHDFVTNFPEMLRAASILVTKAGPGTIAEACASGCPLILFDAIPGQEAGNVRFVTQASAGVWAPSPPAVIAALQAWLIGRDAPAALRCASQAALRVAQPDAAARIAALLLSESASSPRHTSHPQDPPHHTSDERQWSKIPA